MFFFATWFLWLYSAFMESEKKSKSVIFDFSGLKQYQNNQIPYRTQTTKWNKKLFKILVFVKIKF